MTILSRFLITFCIILFISETKAAKKIDWSVLQDELEDIPCVQRIQRLHEHSLTNPENQEKCFKYMIEIMQGDHGINEKRQATPDEIKIIGKAIATIRVRSINQKESLFEKVMPQGKLSEHMDALRQWDQNIYHLLSEDKSYVPKLTIFDKHLNLESLIASEKTSVILAKKTYEQESIQENLMRQLALQEQQLKLKEEEARELALKVEIFEKQAEEERSRALQTLAIEREKEFILRKKLKEQKEILEEQGAIIDKVELEKRCLEEGLKTHIYTPSLQEVLSFKGSPNGSGFDRHVVHLGEMKVETKVQESISDGDRTSKDESPAETDPGDLIVVASDLLEDWTPEFCFSPVEEDKNDAKSDDFGDWDSCV